MMKKILLLLTTCIVIGHALPAQQSIGTWRVHLPFNQARSVTETPERIYVAANDAVFYYNKNDNSVQPISKVNGLSDISVSTIKYNTYDKIVVLGYLNGNIDLFKNGRVINIPEIKNKTIAGSKSINHISFINQFAYLSCPFGIVVLDTEREEIKDTYYLTTSSQTIPVYGTANDGTYLYAAAEDAVYRALLSDPYIYNPNNWSKILTPLPGSGPYNLIVRFKNKIMVNHVLSSGLDSCFIFDGSNWTSMAPDGLTPNRAYFADDNYFLVANSYSLNLFDVNLNKLLKIDNYNGQTASPYDAIVSTSGKMYAADSYYGLVEYDQGATEFIYPNGPLSGKAAQIKIQNSTLWVGHAIRNNNWLPIDARDGASRFSNNTWQTYNGKTVAPTPALNIDSIADLVATCIDPNNPDRAFFGSWGHGLLENNNGQFTLYNPSNSPIQNLTGFGNYYSVRVGGLAFDNQSNLWITNTYVDSCIIVKRSNGTWKRFNPPYADASNILADVLIDSYNYKWIINYRKGIIVMNDNNTIDVTSDDQYRFLNDQSGQGKLPSASVYCMAEDKDGQIWLGTEKGVAVIYSPAAVFDAGGVEAQQILINYGGYYEYLLSKEIVTCIAIDGANRKWFGTQSSGVFLMSADGTKQLQTFNTSNSPLQSNNIYSIAIDDKTGEVFFATERGIISYQGDAIEGEDGCKDVYTYPNPVRPDYSGPIAIKGLASNSNVKITDISGNAIFETTALGSQAIWNGTDFNGQRVQTGVYIVLCTDSEGNNTCMTKILFVN